MSLASASTLPTTRTSRPLSNGAAGSGRVRVLTYAVLLTAAGMLAYENSFQGVFVFDDFDCIVNNPGIRRLPFQWASTESVTPGGLERRAVGGLTFALNYAAHGLDVWGYHLVNLVIHIAAGLFLMGLIRRTLLLDRFSTDVHEAASTLAFAAALLWLIHPLQTESVTYIVQRLESLMGLFFLASLYFLSRAGSPSTDGCLIPLRRRTDQFLALALGCLCIATKEVGLMLPFVALLYDRCFLSDSWRETFRNRGVLHGFLLAAMACQIAFGMERVPIYLDRPDAGERATSWEYLRSQPGVLLHYLALAFRPVDLCLDYLWPIAHDRFEIYGKGAIICAVVLTGIVLLQRRPTAGFLIVSYFLVLAPSSTVVPLHLAFEHRMYVSLACISVGVVVGTYLLLARLSSRLRLTSTFAKTGTLGVALCLTLPLVAATRARNETYHNRIHMWQDVVRVSPHNVRGYMNLAGDLADAGHYPEAEDHYRRAIRLKPTFDLAYYNFGVFVHHRQQSPRRAIYFLQRAVDLKPQRADYRFALASAYEDLEDHERAEAEYLNACRLNPRYSDAYHNLGRILRLSHRYADAIRNLERAIELSPERWQSWREIAKCHASCDRSQQAVTCFETALANADGVAASIIRQELAWTLATTHDDRLRDPRRALELALQACRETNRYEAWDAAAAAAAELGDFETAIRSLSRALDLVARNGAGTPAETKAAAGALNQRLALYRAGKHYRAVGSSSDGESELP